MKIINLIIFLFLIPITNYGQDKIIRDSIIVLKSNEIEILNFEKNKITDSIDIKSKMAESENYHIINFSTSEIILFYKLKGKEWKNKKFKFYSTKESEKSIEFILDDELSPNIHFDINPYNEIVYPYNRDTLLSFRNLKKFDNEEFQKLGLYKWVDSFKPVEIQEQKIKKYEDIKNFEFSEVWKQESFKKAIEFIKQKLNNSNPKCTLTKRSSYNSQLINYIGNQGNRVKVYIEFDCNQNYINQSYFLIDTYYLGKNKWKINLVDQKLTH